MKWMLKSVGAIAAAVGLMAGIHAAAAHHSGTMFDRSRSEAITGTVKELRWVNPHVSILVYGAIKEGDEPTEWLLEMTSPSVLGRLGWKRTTFQPGDRVQANFNPLRDTDEHGGSLKSIMSLDTGKAYSTNLREQEDLGSD